MGTAAIAMPTAPAQLDDLLQQVAQMHKHLCPRQVLGVRLGMFAAQLFPDALPQQDKRILAIVEMDGCFADGVSVATGCSMGHRTMRLADEGKIAVTFADIRGGRAVRVFAWPDLRIRAIAAAPGAANRWQAYLDVYRRLAPGELFGTQEVRLSPDVAELLGKPGARVACAECGEEILNLRERVSEGKILCRSCAGESYWRPMNC